MAGTAWLEHFSQLPIGMYEYKKIIVVTIRRLQRNVDLWLQRVGDVYNMDECIAFVACFGDP